MTIPIIASVATIPPRIFNGDLKKYIDSILSQTYPVNQVFVAMPYNYKRFNSLPDKDLPSWLKEEPYISKVKLLRPENDPGSISKYLCIANYLQETNEYTENDPFIFVGDDDQVYNSSLIENMLKNTYLPETFKGVIQNNYETVRYGSGGIIHGFVGLLVRSSCLQALSTFPIAPSGFCIDDQIMSIYCAYYNIPIIASKVEILTDIYGELINNREKGVNAPEALHMAGDRNQFVYEIKSYYNIEYMRGGGIQLNLDSVHLPVTLINSYSYLILVGSEQYKQFFNKINSDLEVFTTLSECKNQKTIDCLFIDTTFIGLCNEKSTDNTKLTLFEIIFKFLPYIKQFGDILIKLPIPINIEDYLLIKKISNSSYFKTQTIQQDNTSLFQLTIKHTDKSLWNPPFNPTLLQELEDLVTYENNNLNKYSWNSKYTPKNVNIVPSYFKDNFFNLTTYIVNLDRNKDRYSFSYNNVINAGFNNVKRFKGTDAKCDDLDKAWKDHGNPKFNKNDINFNEKKGHQGCMLSHLYIWKDIIENKIPYCVVFEDDVRFHSEWKNIIHQYVEHTPTDFDILYIGSQIEIRNEYPITVVPVYCTHAYIITFNGAQKLYSLLLNNKEGVFTIDRMIIEMMYNKPQFKWYVWNATMIPDNYKKNKPSIEKRNGGLVFQDDSFESDVSNYDI